MKDNIAYVPVAKRRAMQVPKNLKLRRKKFSALDEMIEHLCYRTSLVSVRERAHGIAYTEPLLTGWKPPLKIKRMSKRKCDKIRKRRHIVPRKSILDVIQEVEYVKQEAKTIFLLECLQKTPPPVLIFCDNKADVDDIHEYLLSKGLEAVAIHVGKDQEEREYAISSFKAGQKDVLVATDVASKELDFPDIQHVINFDMPNHFVRYVERIGRTGRCGKTGIATTFISKNLRETLLLDLKHLLKATKQRIPPVLAELHEKMEDVEANWM